MNFDEKKAIEIIKKFGLNEKTMRVWRSRNAIPNRYADDNYQPRKVSKSATVKQNRLLDLLRSGTINQVILSEITGVSSQRITDALRNKTALSDADTQACLNEIKRLKIEIARTFKSFQPGRLKRLYKNPIIIFSKVVNNAEIMQQISYVRCDRAEPDLNIFELTKDKYIIFALTLNL